MRKIKITDDISIADERLSMEEKTKFRQHIDRCWRGDLDVFEYAVITLIFDRSIGWGEKSEYIKLREFEYGRKNAFSGTGICRRKLIDLLKSMEDRKIIVRHGDRMSPYSYAINVNWLPYDFRGFKKGSSERPMIRLEYPLQPHNHEQCRLSTP